jgi:hypothetical protein
VNVKTSDIAMDALTQMVEDMQTRLSGFVTKLQNSAHPAEVFSWSEDDVRNAVFFQVYRHLVRLAQKSPQDAIEVARREAIKGARWLPSSTSTMANLVAAYTTAAHATFVDEWAEALEAE